MGCKLTGQQSANNPVNRVNRVNGDDEATKGGSETQSNGELPWVAVVDRQSY